MTTTSAWLQKLGQDSINVPDISSTNYDSPTADREKVISDQIDEFDRTVAAQAEQIGNFFEQSNRNKIAQFNQLANITESGVKLKNWWDTYSEEKAKYDAWLEPRLKGEPPDSDQVIIEQNENENKINNARVDNRKVSTELAKDGVDIGTVVTVDTGADLIQINHDTDTSNVINRYYPVFRLKLESMPITIYRGTDKEKTIVLKDLNLGEPGAYEDYLAADIEIDRMFLTKVAELGLTKGALHKHIYKPLYQRGQLRVIQLENDISKAATAFQTQRDNDILVAGINSGNYSVVLNQVQLNNAGQPLSDSGKFYGSQQTITQLKGLVTADRLSLEKINTMGDHMFTPHGWDKEISIRDFFNEHHNGKWDELEEHAEKKVIADNDHDSQTQTASEQSFVRDALEEAKSGQMTAARAQAIVTEFRTKFGHDKVPQRLLKIWTDTDQSDEGVIERLKYFKRNKLEITQDMVNLITDDDLWAEWNKEVGLPGLTTAQKEARFYGIEGKITTYLGQAHPGAHPSEIRDIKEKLRVRSQAAYNAAWSDHLKNFPGDFIGAHQAGLDAVENGLADTYGKIKYSPQGVALGFAEGSEGTGAWLQPLARDPKFVELERDLKITNQNLKSGRFNILSEQAWSGPEFSEEPHLAEALRYIKGETNEIPNYYRNLSARYKNLSPLNFMLARLEATGMLKEAGINAVDVSPGFAELEYRATDGTLWRVLNENQKNLAEGLDSLGKFDYNTVQSETNEPLVITNADGEEISLQDATLMDIYRFVKANPTAKLGRYGITHDNIKLILDQLGTLDPNTTLFNQDIQDSIVLAVVRARTKESNKNNCVNQGWMNQFNMNDAEIKELCEIIPLLKEYPFMQLQNLLPDIAKVVLQEATINQ